jgi:hypothetical protein
MGRIWIGKVNVSFHSLLIHKIRKTWRNKWVEVAITELKMGLDSPY